MIYTVGDVELYAGYIRQHTIIQKSTGGSVWKTLHDAEEYLLEIDPFLKYNIFGVDASWDEDTEIVIDCKYRILNKKANIIELSSDDYKGIDYE